jgi:hypothetical protein
VRICTDGLAGRPAAHAVTRGGTGKGIFELAVGRHESGGNMLRVVSRATNILQEFFRGSGKTFLAHGILQWLMKRARGPPVYDHVLQPLLEML